MVEYQFIQGCSNYKVGTDGSVWSHASGRWKQRKANLFLGRRALSLGKNCSAKMKPVSHLVLEAFVGPRPEGMFACHNNGDKTDDRLENLRWDTPRNNNLDAIKHGTGKNYAHKGEDNGMAKLTQEQVLEIQRLRASGLSYRLIKEKLGLDISFGHMANLISGRYWKHLQTEERGDEMGAGRPEKDGELWELYDRLFADATPEILKWLYNNLENNVFSSQHYLDVTSRFRVADLNVVGDLQKYLREKISESAQQVPQTH